MNNPMICAFFSLAILLITSEKIMSNRMISVFSSLAILFIASVLNHVKFNIKKLTGKVKTIKSSLPLPPGPVPWPLVGNLPEFLRKNPRSRWIFSLMDVMNTDIACVRIGTTHIIPVKCPKLAREFLLKQDANFASRPVTMATEYVSHGFLPLATAPLGDYWKKMRRVAATELFSPSRMRWLHDKRAEEADNLIWYIYNQSSRGAGVVNVRHITTTYTGNVIRKLMFNKRYFGEGKNDGGPTEAEDEHVEAIFTGLALSFSFCVSDYLPYLRWLDLDGHEKMMKSATKTINKYHNPIVDDRIQQRGERSSFAAVNKPEDLLDVLISLEDENGKPLLSTDEIKAIIAELVHAAVDNPANATEWALAEMINQPDILRKAVDEIDRVVGKDRLLQESDIPKLNYVKACAREAFRLHPMAIFNLPHVSSVNTTVAGYFIPKGSHVLLSRTGLGRNPNVWADPLKFIPERHLNGSTDIDLKESELRFISFSTGRRGCLAAPLGTAMTIMLLGRLLQGFDWNVPAAGGVSVDLTESKNNLMLAEPLHAHATPRLNPQLYIFNH